MPQITVTPMKLDGLYRQERYSDNVAGIITECIPVTDAGEGRMVQDPVRSIVYLGETMIIRNGQMNPLGFIIPAESLVEAVEKFAQACEGKLDEIESMMIQQRMMQGVGQQTKGIIIDSKSKK